MGAPVLAGMGVGALTALATGKDPLTGAAIGGASGGMFGGTKGFGSGFGFDDMGFDLGSGVVNSSVGVPQFGSVVTPENTPSLLMDSAYDALVTPTDVYKGDLSMMAANNLGATQTIGLGNPDLFTGGGYDPTMGAEQLNYRPDFTPIAGTNEGGGGYEYGLLDNFKVSDYTPSNAVMNEMAMGMGINALTPEQRKRLEIQQANIARGNMPQGYQGIGGNYISRA